MKYRDCVTWAARVALISGWILWNGWYAAAADVVEPFNGKDLTGWKFRGNANKSKWVVGTAKLKEGQTRGGGSRTGRKRNDQRRSFPSTSTRKRNSGDCLIELEVMVPEGSNSGISPHGQLRNPGARQLRQEGSRCEQHGRRLRQDRPRSTPRRPPACGRSSSSTLRSEV